MEHNTARKQVNNSDGFFNDLPNLSSVRKPKWKRKSKIFQPTVVNDDEESFDEADDPNNNVQVRMAEVEAMRMAMRRELKLEARQRKLRKLARMKQTELSRRTMSEKPTTAFTTASNQSAAAHSESLEQLQSDVPLGKTVKRHGKKVDRSPEQYISDPKSPEAKERPSNSKKGKRLFDETDTEMRE